MTKPSMEIKKPKNKVEQEPEVGGNEVIELAALVPAPYCNYAEESAQPMSLHGMTFVEARPLQLILKNNNRINSQLELSGNENEAVQIPRRSTRLQLKRELKQEKTRSRSNLRLQLKKR